MADLASMGIVTGVALIMPDLAAEVATDLVAIPGGVFSMGATDLTEWEQPVHRVQVPSLRIQAHQVTNRLYAEHSVALAQARHVLTAQNPRTNRPVVLARAEDPRAFDTLNRDHLAELFDSLGNISTVGALRTFAGSFQISEIAPFNFEEGLENRPVVARTWYEALTFLFSAGLRFPTEAEWEYGAKGPKHEAKYGTASGNLSHAEARYYDPEAREQGPVDVGSYRANGFGLYDMAGNAYDWVADWLAKFGKASDIIQDPRGPVTGTRKVVRGGGWVYNVGLLRSAFRYDYEPDGRYNIVGFRGVSPEDSTR